MSSDEEGGKSYHRQSLIVSIIKKAALLGIIGFVTLLFIPELLYHVMIIVILISILSGDWIKKHPFVQLIVLIALIGFILFFVATTFLTSVGLISEREFVGFRSRLSESWFRFNATSFNPFAQWREFQDRQTAIATGDHFSGQVEQSKDDLDLGLYLEDLQSSGMNLIEGESAVFWVTLRGKSLGDSLINGKIGCNASNGDEFRTTGEKDFSLFSYEMEQFECRFSRLPSGTTNIFFWAEYNFRTLGYKKAYFIDQERLRTQRSLGQDPLREAGITDRNPISIYTQGPISIGIGTSDYQPIPLRENYQRVFVLGITLETRPRWKGEISRINELEIQIHRSMYIRGQECDYKFNEITNENCIQRCQGVGECELQCNDYYFYTLDEEEIEKIGNIDKYITFKCPIYLENKNELLGTSPVATRFFRVITDYDFKSEINRLFTVQKIREENEN